MGKSAWIRGVPLLALAGVGLALAATTPGFTRPATLADVLALASLAGVLAIGQSLVLLGGGFDLSQGAVLGLSAATGGVSVGILRRWGVPPEILPWLAGGIAVMTGTLVGAANGAVVALARVNPFVVTLSALWIARGLSFSLLGGRPLERIETFAGLDGSIELGSARLSHRVLVFAGVTALAWAVTRGTVFGRHLVAVGGNARASHFAGVPVRRTTIAAYATSGATAGLAAVMLLAWLGVAKPDTGTGYELASIAACVVGGISLRGGRGHVLGAAAGALMLQALGTLITLRDWPDEYRTLITGAVILSFAVADASVRRRD